MAEKSRERRVADVITTILPPSFVQSPKRVWKWKWTQAHNWRSDEIYTVFRETDFAVNAHVVLPPEPGSEFDFRTLAMVNLPTLSGQPDALYRWSKGDKALDEVRRHLLLVLDWFENFKTPSSCLQYLESDTNRNPQSPAYQYCHQYLSRMR